MGTIPSEAPQGKHYVYTLAYPDGKVFYVGKGQGNRIDQHEWMARENTGPNPHKNNVIRKIWANGAQVIKEKVAHFETHEEACMYEIASIFLMRGYGNLTNKTDGGDGFIGLEITEEARRRMSEAKKGKPSWNKGVPMTEEQSIRLRKAHFTKMPESQRQGLLKANTGRSPSEETRRKLSESHKGQPSPNKGKPLPEYQKQRLREARIGRKPSPEAKAKMRTAKLGKKPSPEAIAKTAAANRGKKRSPETIAKVAAAHRGMKRSPEAIANMRAGQQRRRAWEGHAMQLSLFNAG